MGTIVIAAVAALFLVMGVLSLAAPASAVRPFGLRADTPDSRSEVRAVHGGLGIAVAVVLAVAIAHDGGLRTGAVVAVGAALVGMALGRLVSRVIDGPTGSRPVRVSFWGEVVAAVLLLLAA